MHSFSKNLRQNNSGAFVLLYYGGVIVKKFLRTLTSFCKLFYIKMNEFIDALYIWH